MFRRDIALSAGPTTARYGTRRLRGERDDRKLFTSTSTGSHIEYAADRTDSGPERITHVPNAGEWA